MCPSEAKQDPGTKECGSCSLNRNTLLDAMMLMMMMEGPGKYLTGQKSMPDTSQKG